MNKSGYFEFRPDGTYLSNFAEGNWQVIDENSFWKKNSNGDMYILKFDDDYGREATLVSPTRNPPSKLILYHESAVISFPIKTESNMMLSSQLENDIHSIYDNQTIHDLVEQKTNKYKHLENQPIPVKQLTNKRVRKNYKVDKDISEASTYEDKIKRNVKRE